LRIHDYGTGEIGRQTGGWLTRESQVIKRLEKIVATLRLEAVPLRDYLAN
jgi:hypothetical protein